MTLTATNIDLTDWIPAAVPCDDAPATLEWRFAGDTALDDSFFEQTIARIARQYPDHSPLRTKLTALLDIEPDDASLAPTAFVFHIGRCGSTVLSNALRAVAGAISLGEPAPICALLLPPDAYRWPYPSDEWRAIRGELFRRAVQALGRKRLGAERHYFAKMTEWNVLEAPFVRSLFPNTPFVFVYREPLEVVASFLSNPPRRLLLRTMPARMFGIDANAVQSMWIEEYFARIVGRLCRAAIDGADDRTTLMNYSRLDSDGVVDVIARVGIDPSEIDRVALDLALGRYAKDARPERRFEPDGATKRAALSSETRAMVERFAEPAYAALERMGSGALAV